MIILFIILSSTELITHIDSLKCRLEQNLNFQELLKLNNAYQHLKMFDSANVFLKKYENRFGFEEQAQLNFLIGDNLLFKGEPLSAREQYLKTVARFSSAKYANEALERLYLLESARKDTVALKRLLHAVYLFEIRETEMAEDSLKALIRTVAGEYALYYLSLVYVAKNELGKALSALEQLNVDYPKNQIYQAKLLMAEICHRSGRKKEARKLLEDLIVKHPNSPAAIRARELLKNP